MSVSNTPCSGVFLLALSTFHSRDTKHAAIYSDKHYVLLKSVTLAETNCCRKWQLTNGDAIILAQQSTTTASIASLLSEGKWAYIWADWGSGVFAKQIPQIIHSHHPVYLIILIFTNSQYFQSPFIVVIYLYECRSFLCPRLFLGKDYVVLYDIWAQPLI